ncbi:MAG: malonate decarboxylase subunit alpha [Pseudomonadota bacterium]|nr:malonate decarboxylase subunit alpha [Pseudomonadota bacterium]
MKILSAEEAVSLIEDNWCVVPGGFGSCGHPDCLTQALRNRFLETGTPTNLSLLFAAGPGDKKGNGLDALALEGLVGKAIGGFWGLCPELAMLASKGIIEAHNWPQGVISKLFSTIASGAPGIFTPVGLGTFIDPDLDGGVLDSRQSKPLVEKVSFKGDFHLFYPAQKVDCALLRGTAADTNGNISFSEETSYMDALSQAQAAKNSGGIVIVQVKQIVEKGSIEPGRIRIPGFLVDFVVIAPEERHPQTYGKHFDPSYTSSQAALPTVLHKDVSLQKRIITYRAALELKKHPKANVNLGIGIPALIGAQANSMGIHDYTLTVESGLVGGIPDEGLSFGATMNPEAVIEQSALFDFYDGGGIDLAFLGFAEADMKGNVNVSRFGRKITGSGGFINISQSAKKIVFCGTFTSHGLNIKNSDGRLVVLREGSIKKFCQKVSHLTFNGASASEAGKEVLYVTERAVFRLVDGHLELVEIAPGIDVSSLRDLMECDFGVSQSLESMPGFDVVF